MTTTREEPLEVWTTTYEGIDFLITLWPGNHLDVIPRNGQRWSPPLELRRAAA